LTFDFPAPIFDFGAYFTGVGSTNGVTTIEFNDGAAQIFPLVETTLQSVQFFGFTSTVAINQLTLRISPKLSRMPTRSAWTMSTRYLPSRSQAHGRWPWQDWV